MWSKDMSGSSRLLRQGSDIIRQYFFAFVQQGIVFLFRMGGGTGFCCF
jgi:hypothetical protein